MTSSVESRIVTMKFDNTSFQKGVSDTLSVLDKLKGAITGLPVLGKGLSFAGNIASSLNPLRLMGSTVNGISGRFVAMGTVAVTAISRITNAAIDAGVNLAKSLTVAPIAAGYQEYSTNLNSIQTILANTQASGATLEDVNGALAQLNHYSDKTIYNFGEMARNIGTFTAAGVGLDQSVASIKGIANLAALSGSNSQQASTAMYQLSQAIAAGRVSLMDWNSVVNAGMGGATFQRALAQTAAAMGVIDENAVSLSGDMKNVTINGKSFRESIMAAPGQQSWLTSDVLTNTLAQFTGDMSAAQLKAQGFNDQQIKNIQQMAKTAQEAATKVKTISQLIDVAKETVGSGWSKTWMLVFGDFEQARKSMTNASTTINGYLNKMSNARNKVLKDWQKDGGRLAAIQAIKAAFKGLLDLLGPIHDAWRDVFPATTGKQLADFTRSIRDFFREIRPSEKTMDGLHRTFRGIFAVLDIGIQIIKGVVRYFTSLIGLVSHGTGGFLSLTGSIGDLLYKLDQWLKKGNFIGKFFDTIIEGRAKALGPLIEFLGNVLEILGKLAKIGGKALGGALIDGFHKIEPVLTVVMDKFNEFITMLNNGLDNVDFSGFAQALGSIKDAVSGFSIGGGVDVGGLGKYIDIGDEADSAVDSLSNVEKAMDPLEATGEAIKSAWDHVVDGFAAVGRFLAPVLPAIQSIFGGIKDKIAEFFSGMGIEDGLSAVNTAVFIALYLQIRTYVKTISKMFESFGKVGDSASGLLKQATGNLQTMQNSVRAEIILKIAGALILMAGALWIMSKIPGDDLKKALVGLTAVLLEVTTAMITMEKAGSVRGAASAVIAATGMVTMASAIVILAGAVAIFGRMKTDTIKKGLTTVGIILAAFTAMAILMTDTGAALGIIAAAGAIILLVAALYPLAGAIALYAKMDTGKLASGLLKIVASLIALGAGMVAMVGALPGAAATVVASVALIMLAGALTTIAQLDWSTVLKGLAVMGTLALGLAVMSVLSVPIALLGAAIVILGTGMLAAGAGMVMFSTGLATLAVSGAAGVAVLIAAVISIGEAFPLIAEQFGIGIRTLAAVIIKSAPSMYKAFTVMMAASLKAVRDLTPDIGATLIKLLKMLLSVVRSVAPDYYKTFFTLLLEFLKAAKAFIGPIADKAADLAAAFMRAMGKQSEKLTDAGADMIIDFLHGIAKTIRKKSEDIRLAGVDIASAIIEGLTGGLLTTGMDLVEAAATKLADALPGWMKKVLGIESPSKVTTEIGMYTAMGLEKGIQGHSDRVRKAAEGVSHTALDTIKTTMSRLGDAATSNVNVNPTITPVLDLSNLQRDASQISGMLASSPLSTNLSLSAASDISNTQDSLAAARAAVQEAATQPREVKFEQTNVSPKALSAVEIYRNTRNQLSLAKEVLKT